jgi:hypothetical protein
MNEELRCYTWTLYQLSPIQQGIQAGHAAVELMIQRDNAVAREWAEKWKTMVLLNGGDASDLADTYLFLASTHNPFQWASFRESKESLDGIMTSIAIILPARIFGTAENMRKLKAGETIPRFGFTPFEYLMIEKLVATGLAR